MYTVVMEAAIGQLEERLREKGLHKVRCVVCRSKAWQFFATPSLPTVKATGEAGEPVETLAASCGKCGHILIFDARAFD